LLRSNISGTVKNPQNKVTKQAMGKAMKVQKTFEGIF
jgi:hypothetical protein